MSDRWERILNGDGKGADVSVAAGIGGGATHGRDSQWEGRTGSRRTNNAGAGIAGVAGGGGEGDNRSSAQTFGGDIGRTGRDGRDGIVDRQAGGAAGGRAAFVADDHVITSDITQMSDGDMK